MKAHRIWLLLLLAVLIPVRGALAAAMLCAPAGAGTPPQAQPMDHPGHDAQAAAPHDHSKHHGDDSSPEQDKCDVCASFCCGAPLLSSHSSPAAAADVASAEFPVFSVRAARFVSGGPERPPRST